MFQLALNEFGIEEQLDFAINGQEAVDLVAEKLG